jgi:hypothetical protein
MSVSRVCPPRMRRAVRIIAVVALNNWIGGSSYGWSRVTLASRLALRASRGFGLDPIAPADIVHHAVDAERQPRSRPSLPSDSRGERANSSPAPCADAPHSRALRSSRRPRPCRLIVLSRAFDRRGTRQEANLAGQRTSVKRSNQLVLRKTPSMIPAGIGRTNREISPPLKAPVMPKVCASRVARCMIGASYGTDRIASSANP